MKRAIIPLLFVGFLACTAQHGQAQGRGLYGGLPYFGYGFSGSLYGLGRVPVPPYYALHPPVYYSHPVARPYGTSPYAALPYRPTTAPAPRLTVNPHFPAIPAQSESRRKTVKSAPKSARVILNPFFTSQPEQLAGDK